MPIVAPPCGKRRDQTSWSLSVEDDPKPVAPPTGELWVISLHAGFLMRTTLNQWLPLLVSYLTTDRLSDEDLHKPVAPPTGELSHYRQAVWWGRPPVWLWWMSISYPDLAGWPTNYSPIMDNCRPLFLFLVYSSHQHWTMLSLARQE